MSFDLYLLPLKFWQGTRAAQKLLERLDDGESGKPLASVDVRTAADVLRKLEPRYEPCDIDYAEIARFEKISVEDAKAKYGYVELNGPEQIHPPLAQFTFYRNHVAIHWYSGTSQEEMFQYLKAISKHTGLTLFDPQDGRVYRLGRHGEFK